MTRQLKFFLALSSPWTYLATPRIRTLVADHGLDLQLRPFDIFAVFQRNGIKLLGDRPAPVQKNRLNELRRWRAHLGMDLTLEPRYFPVDPTLSGKMLAAATGEPGDAPEFAWRVMRACWAEERNIAAPEILTEIASECGFDGDALLQSAQGGSVDQTFASNTEEAIEHDVFGAPTFVYGDEVFWGQDRIEFLRRTVEAST